LGSSTVPERSATRSTAFSGLIFSWYARDVLRASNTSAAPMMRRLSDLLATQPVWVAGPIPPLVVVAHCRDDVAKVCERREDLGPNDHVLFDVLETRRG